MHRISNTLYAYFCCRYIKNEEIPPFILDVLDKFDFLFYSGCVIAEVRNYRQAYPENKCYTHHVLLRPTQKVGLVQDDNGKL